MRGIVYLFIGIVFLFSCQNNNANQKDGRENPVTVKEVLQTTKYTYLLVQEGNVQKWLAMPKTEAAVGEQYYYKGGMLMTNFTSKELSRTFDEVWFLGGVSKNPITQQNNDMIDPHAGHNHQENPHANTDIQPAASKGSVTTAKEEVKIESVSGGITIEELFSNKEKYANKKVIVKGKVTKFSQQIMGRNWIHIQDGTDANGEYDLTITSNETVTVGDIVALEGVVALDKDFGYGYFYKVIIEEGKIVQ